VQKGEIELKRIFAAIAIGLLTCCSLHAEEPVPCAVAGVNNAYLGIQTIRLWSGDAPQAHGKACQDTPTLTIFEPRGQGNGAAVVVLPGGAYRNLAGTHEGREIADWFTERGFRAFILSYRLSSNGYLLPVPLLDARRAIQTVRARALDYHIDPDRIVMIGFSAGGHLAAPIVRDFLKLALVDKPPIPFRVPPGIKLIRVDAKSGMRAGPGDPKVILEAFKPGTAPPDSYSVIGTEAASSGGGMVSPDSAAVPVRPGTGGLY